MTEQSKIDPSTQMQQVARQIQQTLSKYGNSLTMGSEPTIVVFQANPNPAEPEAERMWHAGIVYRQHVARDPARALASLGSTIFETASRLDAQELAVVSEDEGPVKEIVGGGIILPDVGE